MKDTKQIFKLSLEYIKTLAKWLIIAAGLGAAGGITGGFFHRCIDYVSEFRAGHSYMIYLLPLGGLLIVSMYRLFRSKGKMNTNRIIQAVSEDGNIPIVMVPLIFISTVITHMLGGSAGREGAALQIGGGIGYNLGKILKFDKKDIRVLTMAGMSSMFAALFGTPVTAAIFPLEMIRVGALNFTAFFPCIIASATAFHISSMFGISPMTFDLVIIQPMSAEVLLKVILLAVCCAILSIVFCTATKKCKNYMNKLFHNRYLRAFIGGGIIVILTVLVGTYDYNGTGMDVIERAISGQARATDFIFKIIFTAVTISAGFKGGEIIPSLFIGATFGCVISGLLGLEPGFGAAIGLISLFCGVVNCPVASIFLSAEMFGTQGILFFSVACAVSYIMSGYSGLYKSQRIVYSKLTAEESDANVK